MKKINTVAVDLLKTLKIEKLRVDHWRDKEAMRDAVRLAIQDFLSSDEAGRPIDNYDKDELRTRAKEVYRHVYRVYPTFPSPYYESSAVA